MYRDESETHVDDGQSHSYGSAVIDESVMSRFTLVRLYPRRAGWCYPWRRCAHHERGGRLYCTSLCLRHLLVLVKVALLQLLQPG